MYRVRTGDLVSNSDLIDTFSSLCILFQAHMKPKLFFAEIFEYLLKQV